MDIFVGIIVVIVIIVIYALLSKNTEKMTICATCAEKGSSEESILINPFLRPVSKCQEIITDSDIAENTAPANMGAYFSSKHDYDHQFLTS